MERKHTPGPWEAWEVYDEVDQRQRLTIAVPCRCVVCRDSLRLGGVGVHGGTHITALYEWGGGIDEEVRANARLIAAAPDLLAACEAAAEHFRDTDAPLGEMLRAAIARATDSER